MQIMMKGLILLLFACGSAWAAEPTGKQTIQSEPMQALTDEELEVVADHLPAYSATEEHHDDHHHHHEQQDDVLSVNQQERTINSAAPLRLPIR